MNKNPSQVAIAWLGFLISHTSALCFFIFIQQSLGIRRKSFNQPQAFSTNPFNFFKGSTEISHLTQIGH